MDQAERQFLDKLIRVTEANLADESFGVTQLAREMGVNRSGLYRKVKAFTKKSISQFIREQRLKKALELLRENSLNISEIAFGTGFSSVSYFNRCFHQFYGCQPGEARRKMAESVVTHDQAEGIPSIHLPEGIRQNGIKSRLVPPKSIIRFAGAFLVAAFVMIILLMPVYSRKSIAVLPFINDSEDSTNICFNNGIAEAIRDRLANISDLEVKSRMSSDSYQDKRSLQTKRIARKLKVRYIVEGSSQKSGDHILITVQLIDGHEDKHLFSRQYERRYEELFSLYGEIALDVAGEISAVITPEEKKLIREPISSNLEAIKWTITGQDLLNRTTEENSQTMEFRNQAEKSYRKAILLDSTNSNALTGLARICFNRDNPDSALLLADKALFYNSENVNAWLLKGEVYIASRMPLEAEKNLRNALKFDPEHFWAHHLLGGIHYSRGEFCKAFQYLLKSGKLLGSLHSGFSRIELLQTELYTLRMARTLFAMGFYEEGKKYALQWYKLSDDSPWGYYYNLFAGGIINGKFEEVFRLGMTIPEEELCLYYMGMNLIFLERYSEALDYFQKIGPSERLNGRYYHKITFLEAFAYLKTGDDAHAVEYCRLSENYVNQLLAVQPDAIKTENVYAITDRFWQNPLFMRTACAAAWDQKEKALENLRKLRKNYPASDLQVVTFLKRFPMFENIRNEPEFQDYLLEAETHYLSERQKVEKLLREEGIIN